MTLIDDKLKSSGLSPLDGKKLGMRLLTATQTKALDATFLAYPALRIPYFDLKGKETSFYRIRYLGELNGFDALRKKPPRYVQPPGTYSEVYLPPLGFAWHEIADAPDVAVLITEGELKAACGARNGYPVIGLGGVWSWKSHKLAAPLLPILTKFAWKGRSVYLVFDSDFATKPDVMKALLALAHELTTRGAQPYVVALPEPEEGGKYGLDDYLVAHGKDAFNALLREAKPHRESADLWKLNEKVLYVRDPGLIIVTATGQRLSPAAFKEHAYANWLYPETTFNAKGEPKIRMVPLAPAWLAWPARATVGKLTYDPGAPRLTDGDAYNTWPGWGVEPKKGDVKPWVELLDYLFANDAAARTWFERWCAFPIQAPGTKLYSAAVVWGIATGTGKSLVGYTLGRIYGRNFAEIDDQHLASPFNEWAESKQFIMGDDVTGAEYKKTVMDRLKSMITRQQLRLNLKYVPSFTIPDCVNYYFTSNHPDAFIVEDQDRRYFVHEAPHAPHTKEFYSRYDAWYRSNAGAAALFHHLLNLPLGDFDPKGHALRTAAREAMILDSKSDIGAWVATLREAADAVLVLGTSPLRGDLYTTGQLLSLYDPEARKKVTANGLGRELKKAGFRQVRDGATVATAKGPQRLYAVRNAQRWLSAKPAAVTEHWNACFGGGTANEPAKKKEKY